MLRRIPTTAAAITMAVALASCGGSGSGSPAPTTAARTEPSAPTSTTGAAPTTSVPPTGSRCQNGQLSVVPLSGGVGAGSAEEIIGFTNISSTTCTLTGYPGVAALDQHGSQVAQAQRITGDQVATVTLAQGQTASATVSGTEVPTGTATTCPYFAPSLLVTPPDLTRSVGVSVTGGTFGTKGFPGCAVLRVTPVVQGITGQT